MLATEAQALSLFNLRRQEIIANPHPFYRTLQKKSPIHWDQYLKSWVLSGYAEVSALLNDRRLSVAMDHAGKLAKYAPAHMELAFHHLDRHVSFVDPPDHPRMRKPIAQPFRHSAIDKLRDFIDETVSGLLAKAAGSNHLDIVTDFGYRLPLLVIAKLLGLTEVDIEKLRSWSNTWGDIVASFGHLPDDSERQAAIVEELVDYLHFVIADHRSHPREDVTSSLLKSVDAGAMSTDELIANLMILITGGHETTANLISSTMLTLLHREDLARQLRTAPGLLPTAVEEFLRYDSPTQYTARVATTEITLGDVTIKPGQSVVLMLAAANRDPAAFGKPDDLVLDRQGPRHLAFGHGPHFCFGAPLARLEAHAAFAALLTRVRGLRLADGLTPSWRLNGNLRGLASLPVEFDAITIAESR